MWESLMSPVSRSSECSPPYFATSPQGLRLQRPRYALHSAVDRSGVVMAMTGMSTVKKKTQQSSPKKPGKSYPAPKRRKPKQQYSKQSRPSVTTPLQSSSMHSEFMNVSFSACGVNYEPRSGKSLVSVSSMNVLPNSGARKSRDASAKKTKKSPLSFSPYRNCHA